MSAEDELLGKVRDVLGAFLPHTYFSVYEGHITCKFCGQKIKFPITKKQWEEALWGDGVLKLGCASRKVRDRLSVNEKT